MATAKKSTAKKSPAKKPAAKKAPVKKVTASKAAATKPTVKKTIAKKAASAKRTSKKAAPRSASLRSFRVAKATEPFTTFRITRQTVYWIILIAFIIFAQLWILKLQVEIASLLEAQQAELIDSF